MNIFPAHDPDCLQKDPDKKSHEGIFFCTKEWTFMAVFNGFLCCFFCRRAAGHSTIAAASAAVVVHGIYQAQQEKSRVLSCSAIACWSGIICIEQAP